jgi:hypothetical protein
MAMLKCVRHAPAAQNCSALRTATAISWALEHLSADPVALFTAVFTRCSGYRPLASLVQVASPPSLSTARTRDALITW